MAILRALMLKNNQEVAGDGHQLPGKHKGEGIGGQQYKKHASDKQPGEHSQGTYTHLPVDIFTNIGGSITGGDKGYKSNDEEEKPGKRIKA